MWSIPDDKLSVILPEGYNLREDTQFVYLYFGDRQVAAFSLGADPEEIKKAAVEDILRYADYLLQEPDLSE